MVCTPICVNIRQSKIICGQKYERREIHEAMVGTFGNESQQSKEVFFL